MPIVPLTPEWITVYLAVAGALAGSARYVFKRLKHRLQVEVTKCYHKVRYVTPRRKTQVAGTELVIELRILNKSVTTSLYSIELRCKPGVEYRTTENVVAPGGSVKIDQGAVVPYTHIFFISQRELSDANLNCVVILHHTYGGKKVKTTSTLRM